MSHVVNHYTAIETVQHLKRSYQAQTGFIPARTIEPKCVHGYRHKPSNDGAFQLRGHCSYRKLRR
jgi:hypothetical protein